MASNNDQKLLVVFEELKEKLEHNTQQLENIEKHQSQESPNNNQNDLTEEIRQLQATVEAISNEQSEKLNAIEAIIRKEKQRFDFSPTSVNTMLIVLGFMAIIVGLLFWSTSLEAEKEIYSDNDLKYRYFQMIGHATQEEMATMDTIFYFHRNHQKIKELRKQVEIFEENVRQRARIIEQEERLKMKREKIENEIPIKRN